MKKFNPTFLFFNLCLFFLVSAGCTTPLESDDIVFLAKGENESYQLFSLSPTSQNPATHSITQMENDVLDFTLNDYQEIAFTVEDSDLSSDIWLLAPESDGPQKIVDCENTACSNPRWSPTLALFVYERRPIVDGRINEDSPTIWWFDLPTQQSVAVFSADNWIGKDVRFSTDGQSISYVVPLIDEAQIFNITTGDLTGISSRTGTPLEWGKNNDIYFSALLVRNHRSTIHILRTNPENTELIDLSGPDAAVEDGGYSVSPSGEQLIFTRKPPRAPTGSQIWVMDINGTNSRSLTNNLSIQHGSVSWSNDGQQITYQKFSLDPDQAVPPSIWLMDIASGEETFLGNGTRPQWMP